MSRFIRGLNGQLASDPVLVDADRRLNASPLSAELKECATMLARRIEGCEFSELLPRQRADLRWLTMEIRAWADRVETMEHERDDARRLTRRRGERWGLFGTLVRRFERV